MNHCNKSDENQRQREKWENRLDSGKTDVLSEKYDNKMNMLSHQQKLHGIKYWADSILMLKKIFDNKEFLI